MGKNVVSTEFDKQWNQYTEIERELVYRLVHELYSYFKTEDAAWEDIVLKLSFVILERRLRRK